MEPRILVLDGNQRASLASVRALGAKGLWIAVGESTPKSMAGSSRYCRKSLTYTDPFQSPRRCFEDILQQIEECGITFLLPITEATTYILLQFREEIPDHVTLPFPDNKSVALLADKNRLFKLAMDHSVPVPETVFCDSLSEGLAALEQIERFPVVLKPFKSKILQEDRIVTTQVIVANSRDEAKNELQSRDYFRYPFTIQSYIEGTGQGIFALFDHGKPVCYFSHRRLREKPPAGGVSVLCESAPVNGNLKTTAEKLLREASWHGVAMVEFRVADDGTGYLMEVNPRFWGSLQLAVDSGVNFPWWLYLTSNGKPIPKTEWQYRRVRWLLGDLDRLFLVLRAPASAYSATEKFLEILRFFKPGFQTRHEVNRWRDLSPFWFELRQYVRALKG